MKEVTKLADNKNRQSLELFFMLEKTHFAKLNTL